MLQNYQLDVYVLTYLHIMMGIKEYGRKNACEDRVYSLFTIALNKSKKSLFLGLI